MAGEGGQKSVGDNMKFVFFFLLSSLTKLQGLLVQLMALRVANLERDWTGQRSGSLHVQSSVPRVANGASLDSGINIQPSGCPWPVHPEEFQQFQVTNLTWSWHHRETEEKEDEETAQSLEKYHQRLRQDPLRDPHLKLIHCYEASSFCSWLRTSWNEAVSSFFLLLLLLSDSSSNFIDSCSD